MALASNLPAAVPLPAPPSNQILVVGNPLVRSDSLPLRIRPALQKAFPSIDFMLFEPTVQEFPPAPQPLYILDSVEGIREVTILADLKGVQEGGHFTSHDLDLGAQLLLLTKLGRIGLVTIIGVPRKMAEKKAVEEVVSALKKLGF